MVDVTLDPEIFDAQGEAYPDPEEGWNGPSPVFLVQSDQTEQAAQALHRAIIRCKFVGTSGRELTREEDATGEEYTANYYSPVYLTDAGPMAYLDTKGELPRAMGEAMLRILVEELTAQGIDAYLTTPSLDPDEEWQWPIWEPDEG
ncbi:hypothetical protein J7E83_17615 [Arthrobacter sp. ISL-48]|uniref:hypothetical protein n=1 Tax=Arthrobacter sp. ISL-48 TaxID=2819110 RepID=UPI001BEADE6B|nr:hypothetical protein [Arthrobacter sp. ISL-48]MBT2533909.1 hypothetical protein [Arthrobacter sp. ISL-48]